MYIMNIERLIKKITNAIRIYHNSNIEIHKFDE